MSYTPYRFQRPATIELVKKPKLDVAVVIACRGGQEKLDLVLASLAAQSYPAALTHTYIIDDGSDVAITMPKIRPTKTSIIKYKNSNNHWGKTAATNDVAAKLKEDVLWFIDADMIFEPDHLAHHMKWHHDNDDYVVLGWKRFVEEWSYSPAELLNLLKAGRFSELHPKSYVKDLWESRIKYTQELVHPGTDGYRSLVGATFSISNQFWKLLGGYDRNMRTGEDTELGWRVFNSGLRMVPERSALSWHLGVTSIELHKDLIQRHNDPTFAQRMPDRRASINNYDVEFKVPSLDVIIDARNCTVKNILDIRENLAHKHGSSIRFTLLAPWRDLQDRYKVTEDLHQNLREIWHWLGGDYHFTLSEVAADAELSIDNIIERFTPSAIPYHLFIEGAFALNGEDLIDYLIAQEEGLVGVVNEKDQRAFVLSAPALARAHRTGGWIYQNIAQQWGVLWLTHDRFIAIYRDKHNRLRRIPRFLKRELKKIKSFGELKIFIKKIAKIILRKVGIRG